MKRWIALFLLVLLVGCKSTQQADVVWSLEATTPDVWAEHPTQELTLRVQVQPERKRTP